MTMPRSRAKRSYMALVMTLSFLLLPSVVSSVELFASGFTRAFWLSSAVNTGATQLYIDGGEYYTGTEASDDVEMSQLETTIVIDIATSWSSSSISSSQIIQAQKPLNGVFPLARRPVLWFSDETNMLYSWAGWGYGGATQGLWQLELTDDGAPIGMWTAGPVPNEAILPTWASAYAAMNGNMYSLGGMAALDYYRPTPGLVQFKEASGAWTNNTNAPAEANMAFGQATGIAAFGSQGVIIYIGGESLNTLSDISDYSAPPLQGMSNVIVYDIGTQKFYSQAVDGETPSARWGHCTISVTNNDGTVDIFMFGGGASHADFSGQNVYVLSIPAFTWTELKGTSQAPRFNPTCELIGKRQMVVIGGWGATGDIADQDRTRDPFANGIGIFDLSTLKWSETYDAGAPAYTRAPALASALGSRTTPTSWSDPSLASLFTFTPSSSTSTSTPTTPPSNSNGATIGGAVGGVLGALLICGIIAFLLIRRRRRRARGTQEYQAVRSELADTKVPVQEVNSAPATSPQPDPVELPAGGAAWELEDRSASSGALGSHRDDTRSNYKPYGTGP